MSTSKSGMCTTMSSASSVWQIKTKSTNGTILNTFIYSFCKKEESKGSCFKQLVNQVPRSYYYTQYSLYLDNKDTTHHTK